MPGKRSTAPMSKKPRNAVLEEAPTVHSCGGRSTGGPGERRDVGLQRDYRNLEWLAKIRIFNPIDPSHTPYHRHPSAVSGVLHSPHGRFRGRRTAPGRRSRAVLRTLFWFGMQLFRRRVCLLRQKRLIGSGKRLHARTDGVRRGWAPLRHRPSEGMYHSAGCTVDRPLTPARCLSSVCGRSGPCRRFIPRVSPPPELIPTPVHHFT